MSTVQSVKPVKNLEEAQEDVKVQEITKQEDQNTEEASIEYSFTGTSSPKRHSRREGDESKKTHTWSQNKRNFSEFEYEEEEEQKQESRTNKYERKKEEKIVEDLRDSLSSSSSVINEDYSLNIHTHDVNDDPEFHARLEDLSESVTFWKSLKLRNEDVDKKDNCDNIEYSSDRIQKRH